MAIEMFSLMQAGGRRVSERREEGYGYSTPGLLCALPEVHGPIRGAPAEGAEWRSGLSMLN
jgi:hypothetical protein